MYILLWLKNCTDLFSDLVFRSSTINLIPDISEPNDPLRSSFTISILSSTRPSVRLSTRFTITSAGQSKKSTIFGSAPICTGVVEGMICRRKRDELLHIAILSSVYFTVSELREWNLLWFSNAFCQTPSAPCENQTSLKGYQAKVSSRPPCRTPQL